MEYQINEGRFTLPPSATDRSVNMLVLNLGPGGLTLVVTRDVVQEGEDLDSFLTRQLRPLASQVKNFRQQERIVLDTLVEAGVARSRAEALAWCVRLVGENADDWLGRLREAMTEVQRVRDEGPGAA